MNPIRSFFSQRQTIEDVLGTAIVLPYVAFGGVLWYDSVGFTAAEMAYYGIGIPVLAMLIWALAKRKHLRLGDSDEHNR